MRWNGVGKAPDMEIVLLNVINQRDINGIRMAVGYFPTQGPVMLSVDDCIEGLD